MIVLSANNLTKTFGIQEILKDVSFHVNAGDRIGIIGNNGAGKTTLLRILAGDVSASSGDFFLSSEKTVGFLRQQDQFDPEKTVYEEAESLFLHFKNMETELESISAQIAEGSSQGRDISQIMRRYDVLQEEMQRRDGYRYKSEITGILASMAFGQDSYEKKIGLLSGGERTRLALACLLLKKPDILLLDEPTNHLDIGMLKWLEQYLKAYSGTILLISHDRYFLDETVNKIFEVENRGLTCYDGNYSTYADKKRKKREEEWREYEQQQKDVSRQEEMIRRFRQHGTEKLAKRALSRERRLDKIELIEKPVAEGKRMKIHFKQAFKSGQDVFLGEELSKGFGIGENRRILFEHITLDVKRGQRLCIVGSNGIGKTTFLRILKGDLLPDFGTLKTGHNVAIGYYDQTQQLLTESNTVLDELKDVYRLYSDTEMRGILGRFLFKGDAVFQEIRSLSGGEKVRLALAKLMLSGANVLILDEPTNHLDIASKEVFEDALLEFPGTVIAVSHDRYFLNKIPEKILELSGEGLTSYLGTYNYYVEKKDEINSGKKYLEGLGIKTAEQVKPVSNNLEQRRVSKEKEARKRKRQRQKSQAEAAIHETEKRIRAIEEEMSYEENVTDYMRLAEYSKEVEELKVFLSQKYEEWLLFDENESEE